MRFRQESHCLSPLDSPLQSGYHSDMSTQQLIDEILSLPLPERIDVAQTLWESINEAPHTDADEREAIEVAKRRKADLASGTVAGRSHEEVMIAARRAIGCE
jgi:putative addiction module component (TIGR02574 family)